LAAPRDSNIFAGNFQDGLAEGVKVIKEIEVGLFAKPSDLTVPGTIPYTVN
jgi:hypothetical protein